MTPCESVVKKIMGEPYAGNPQVRFEEEGGNPTFTLRHVDGMNLYRGYFIVVGVDPSGMVGGGRHTLVYPDNGHGGLMYAGPEEPVPYNVNLHGEPIKGKIAGQHLSGVTRGKEVKIDLDIIDSTKKPGCKEIKVSLSWIEIVFSYYHEGIKNESELFNFSTTVKEHESKHIEIQREFGEKLYVFAVGQADDAKCTTEKLQKLRLPMIIEAIKEKQDEINSAQKNWDVQDYKK